LIIDIFATRSSKNTTEEIEDDEVHIVTSTTPKKKEAATTKKPCRKIVKEENQDLGSNCLKDHDLETV